MKTQKHPIGNEFDATRIQNNFFDLYQFAHEHLLYTRFPLANEGAVRDIVAVDDGTNVYLCVKTKRGWFKTAILTAV